MAITGTLISNGSMKLVIESDDPLFRDILKRFDGCTIKWQDDKAIIMGKGIPNGCLIIEENSNEKRTS